jgi:hypothetical protein
MDSRQLLFSAYLLVACGYACICGGWPERMGVLINVVGSLLSIAIVVIAVKSWHQLMPAMWAVDLGVCASFFLLAIKSDRFWPVWSFAFAIASVMAHLARLLQTNLPFLAYFRSEAIWVYPALAALMIGTWQHRHGKRIGAF